MIPVMDSGNTIDCWMYLNNNTGTWAELSNDFHCPFDLPIGAMVQRTAKAVVPIPDEIKTDSVAVNGNSILRDIRLSIYQYSGNIYLVRASFGKSRTGNSILAYIASSARDTITWKIRSTVEQVIYTLGRGKIF